MTDTTMTATTAGPLSGALVIDLSRAWQVRTPR